MTSPRIGLVLSPVAQWAPIVEAAKAADELGFEAVGFWDHYHADPPEWAYICGWSAYGAVAAQTSRVRLVPMVLNNLHYDVGVLAKESSVLALASGGRFELGIGAGDWPESFVAWGQPFPDVQTRIARLEETVRALREVWSGKPVTFKGEHVRLAKAASTPTPPEPPRVVVGTGPSARLIERAVHLADELNVYAEDHLVDAAWAAIERSGRAVALSTYVDWSWDSWPAEPAAELASLGGRFDRVFISIGGEDMPGRVRLLAEAGETATAAGQPA